MIATNHSPIRQDTVDPNDTIETLTGRRYVSWSQLNSFRGCPRRWFFSHVEGVASAFVSSALVLGSAFHTAAQIYYERQLQGLETTLEQLKALFLQDWYEQAGESIVRYPKGEDLSSTIETGYRMLEAFSKSELAELPGNMIGIEETLSGPIHPELPDLLARIDIMWLADDGLHVMDLKTSKSRWSEYKVNESADQLLLYQRLATELSPDQPVHLHFGVISKAKKPAVQVLDVPGDTAARSNEVIDLMLPVWDGIKAGVDFASPSPMCSGCGYKSKCPAFRRR